MEEQELADVAGRLYALPFDEFVNARTAAAKTAAAESNRPLAQAIKALPKPSVAAWAINMLAHHQPEALQELRNLGETMQGAQAALDAAALRELSRERRKLLAGALDAARLAAEKQGRPISGPVASEVEETLRAATADAAAAVAVQSGRLLRVLTADGVDTVDLDGAVAVPTALGAVPAAPRATRISADRPATPLSTAPPAKAGRAGTIQTGVKATRRQPPETSEKPRLQAVRPTPRPTSPSLLDKALAALAEAEESAATAAREAQEREEALEEATAEFTRLAAEVRETRQLLTALEDSLNTLRKDRETAAAEAKQAARAADKSQRTAMLAKERVLRLRNTPD
ncbi:hypothetical protein [Arthrobacter sp. ISL-28]|uniref:hypothetical protein n=1 Tax=Arthrobacter sp. ISL-28 TaxID=2819108 RepID=UPI001BE61A00|nr:hypothetical protein [Arthrobacter sp. ISL-28]MBT2520738.1 hypothetical protein [Arthrobacter sp. ISL-28]